MTVTQQVIVLIYERIFNMDNKITVSIFTDTHGVLNADYELWLPCGECVTLTAIYSRMRDPQFVSRFPVLWNDTDIQVLGIFMHTVVGLSLNSDVEKRYREMLMNGQTQSEYPLPNGVIYGVIS